MLNGNVIEKTFQGNEKAEEAETETNQANYLYKTGTEACFMNNESYEQFNLPLEQIGDKMKFLKENTEVDILYFQGQPVSLKLPIKISLKVISSPPGVKGNSAGNVTKTVQLETGAQIPVECRDGEEICRCGGQRITPAGAAAWNPSFDVTPARFVRAFITDRGVQAPPLVKGKG